MRTLILSDLHLGSRSTRADSLLSELERSVREYDRVILNGDTLDRYERIGVDAESDAIAERARNALTPRNGVLEIIAGNHDPAFGTLDWIYLDASQTLIFHGDCIQDYTHPSKQADKMLAAFLGAYWKSIGGRPTDFETLAKVYRQKQREFLIQNPFMYEPCGTAFYLLKVFFPPWRPLHVISYWMRAPGMVARLARTFNKPIKQVLVGHSHRAGDWQLEGLRVVNTGSFMPFSKPWAVIAEGTMIETLPVAELLCAPGHLSLSQTASPKV